MNERCVGCVKTTCALQRINDGQKGDERISIQTKAGMAARLAKTSSAYNGTPAQPHFTEWGKLGEILRGVKFPEQTAKSGFAVAHVWGLANNTGKLKSQMPVGMIRPAFLLLPTHILKSR